MSSVKKPKQLIGRAESISLPQLGVYDIPARIDTGARTSAMWASNIAEHDGQVSYTLFGKGSSLYTGKVITTRAYTVIAVSSSNGHIEIRYKVPAILLIGGRKIKTFFTLTDRSTQAFPLLIGRNTLRGKFIVDVQLGSPALDKIDQDRYDELQSQLERGEL